MYICLCALIQHGVSGNGPLRFQHQGGKMVGESNCGKHIKSMEPFMPTNATVPDRNDP